MSRKPRLISIPAPTAAVAGKPSAPLLSGIVSDVGSVFIQWSPSTPATGSTIAYYRVYRNALLFTDNVTTLSKTYTALTNGTIYTFTVTAVSNEAQESQPSNAVPLAWPYWDASVPVLNAVAGGAGFDISQYANDPDTTVALNYGRTGSAADTGPAGITIDSLTGAGLASAATPAGSYTIEAYASDTPNSSSLLADWTARSTAPGVLWAHIYKTPNDPSLWWGMSPQDLTDKKRAGYIGPAAPTLTDVAEAGKGFVTFDGVVRADGGIMGDGCLEIYVPAYKPTGGLSYRRPLAPTTGAMTVIGTGSTAMNWVPNDTSAAGLDINKAGVARYNIQKPRSGNVGDVRAKLGGMVGGMITNAADYAAYQRNVPASTWNDAAPEITWAGPDGIYIQFRQKFKTLLGNKNRLDYAETKTYVTKTITAGTASLGTASKSQAIFPSGTVAGNPTILNVGIKHECYAPVVIGGVTFTQYITIAGGSPYDGTWPVVSVDTSSIGANKISIGLDSTGFPAMTGGKTWSAIYNLHELTVGPNHDFWAPIDDAGNHYKQQVDVAGGTFTGTYRTNSITTTGIVVRVPWSTAMPAWTGPATATGYFGPSEGKLWNIYTHPTNSGGLSNQIVCTVRPDDGNAFFLFGNAGQNWNYGEKLGGNQVQYPDNPTCNFSDMGSGNCWSYPKDEWITILLHIIPGQQNNPRQIIIDASPDAVIPITSVSRDGKRTVLHVPGLNTPGHRAKFLYSGKGYVIEGPSNWAAPTKTMTILNEESATPPYFNIDFTNELINLAWNTDNMPPYDGLGSLRVGSTQTWDTWRNTPVATHFNQATEVWVATQSDINADRAAGRVPQYRRLHSVLNYQMYFDTDYGVRDLTNDYPPEIAYTAQAPGYNYMELYPYMNPETGAAVRYAFPIWVLYDQFMCSTQFIPCPQL